MYFKLLISLLLSVLATCQSQSNYLNHIKVDKSYVLNISNPEGKLRIVEIFSPFSYITVTQSRNNPILVTTIFFQDYVSRIEIYSFKPANVWYRYRDANIHIPNLDSRVFNLNITSQDNWYTDIQYEPISKYLNFSYELWMVPIYPSGQVSYWSSDYSNVSDKLIISHINNSFDTKTLNQNGVLLKSQRKKSLNTKFRIINRNTYTYLIIIQAKLNERVTVRYTPAIIYGCLSTNIFSSSDISSINSDFEQNNSNHCTLVIPKYWKIVLYCVLAVFILFGLVGYLSEPLQFFMSSFIIIAFVTSIVAHYAIQPINSSDIMLYICFFGVSPGLSLILSIIISCNIKKGHRGRMVANILCIILIVFNLLWFIFEYFVENMVVVFGSIAAVSVILFFLLLAFNDFTSSFGSTFIAMTIISLGFSVVLLNSSGIPYLFLDLFYFLINKSTDVIYYVFFSYNDLIILIFWIFVTMVIGSIGYGFCREDSSKKKPSSVQPINLVEFPDRNFDEDATSYGALITTVQVQARTLNFNNPPVLNNPGPSTSSAQPAPSAPSAPEIRVVKYPPRYINENPPPYEQCC